MNAVILLVWLAGADGAAPAAKPVPGPASGAPVYVHPAPASAGCNDCCDSGGHRLFGKLRGLFHRCDDGCKTNCGPHGGFHHRHQDGCCNEGGHRLFGFLHGRKNDCCEESWHSKLRGRLHGVFRKHDDCCTTTAPAVIHAQPAPALAPPPSKQPAKPAGEKIAPPKAPEKLPKAALNAQPPSVFSVQPPVLNERR